MAYLVSQMRKSSNQSYMERIPVTKTTVESSNPFGKSGTFEDFALSTAQDNGLFKTGEVYYLRFQIHRIPKFFYSGSKSANSISEYEDADELKLQILLKNTKENQDTRPPEIVGSCTVPYCNWNELDRYSSFSFVFSPSRDFERIIFKINRVSFDAINTSSYRKWLTDTNTIYESNPERKRSSNPQENVNISPTGKRIKIGSGEDGDRQEDGDVCKLKNIIPENQSWLKFGYQSRPGSLIVVNGQPIRVGRSGIYEIDNGTKIKSFMIASPGGSDKSKIDAFLLDYAYNS